MGHMFNWSICVAVCVRISAEVDSIPCSFSMKQLLSNMCFTLILNLILFSKPVLLYPYLHSAHSVVTRPSWSLWYPSEWFSILKNQQIICLPQFHPNSLGPFKQGPLTHALNRGVAGDSQISKNFICPHRLPSLVQTHWCTPSIEKTTHTFKNQHAHTNRPPPKFSDFSNTVVTVAMTVTYRRVHGWW